MRKLLIRIRTSMKFIILISLVTFLIGTAINLLYKPIYSVYFKGELVGYCADKSKLQKEISDYVENGNGDNDNLAYVSVDSMPTYKLCLLKRGITTNDDEIFEKIKTTGTSYFKYFAILEKEEEKVYLATYGEAEEIVNALKEKDSNNINDITIAEKYDTEMKEFTSKDDAVSKLYEKKVVVVAKTTTRSSSTTRNTYSSSNGGLNLTYNISSGYVNIGISLIKPVNGTISSKYKSISSIRNSAHTGLDIATSSGTPIKAAAAGKVVYSGWRGGYNGGYGNLIAIDHGNGVQTLYGHCSKLYVSVGQTVSQGQNIAAVGSTGNSTGPHLHFEVRVNGVAYNPQNYVY